MKVEVLSVERKTRHLTIATVRAGQFIGEVPAHPDTKLGDAEMSVGLTKKEGRLVAPLYVEKQ